LALDALDGADADMMLGGELADAGAALLQGVPDFALDGSRAASSSATVPPPRPPSPSYQLPTDTELTRLQIELAQKLEEARALVQQMERLSGLRLVLDRNLRLVVNLTPSK